LEVDNFDFFNLLVVSVSDTGNFFGWIKAGLSGSLSHSSDLVCYILWNSV